MNKCLFTGRLTKDPKMEIIGETQKATFSLAVRRTFKNKDGEYGADFPLLTIWGKRAEFVMQYLKKGDLIEVVAEYRTERKDDKFYQSLNVASIEILSHANPKPSNEFDGYEDIPTYDDGDVPPFNFNDDCDR